MPGGDNLNVTVGPAHCQIKEIADEYIVCVPPMMNQPQYQ